MGGGEPATKPQHGSDARRQSWAGPFPVLQPSTLEKIIALRESVWRNEPSLVDVRRLDPDAAMLHDNHDDHGLHWIITVEGSIVAAARLCIHHDARDLPGWEGYRHLAADFPAPIASLNGMIVHPSMRRQGLSRVLTKARIEAARSMGATTIVVEAAPNRVPPLRDLGFAGLGHSVGWPWERIRFTLMTLDVSA